MRGLESVLGTEGFAHVKKEKGYLDKENKRMSDYLASQADGMKLEMWLKKAWFYIR